MSAPVIFRPLAAQELDEAMAWYGKRKAGLDWEFKEAVEQMLARIVATPLRFSIVHGEVRRALLRRFPYAILYVPERNAIIVLAVFHTKRDPQQLKGRV
jgi:plasmid stabilization system protein ParE